MLHGVGETLASLLQRDRAGEMIDTESVAASRLGKQLPAEQAGIVIALADESDGTRPLPVQGG